MPTETLLAGTTLTLSFMAGVGDRIRAEAHARGMTDYAFVSMVVRDFLTEDAARQGRPHAHCLCRDRRPTGEARCCWCDRWSLMA